MGRFWIKVNSTWNGLRYCRYQGAKIWNELPISVNNTGDVSEFKYRLNEWPGPVCKCGSCELCKFLTDELHFAIARWFYMLTWFCLEVIYIYIYAKYLHISISIYLNACMYMRLSLCTNRCIWMYVYVYIDGSHSHQRLHIIIFSSS